eukprot:SAG31_NODE_1279_length_9036_cov_1.858454_6_plen_294_part_00
MLPCCTVRFASQEPGAQPNGDWWGTPAEYFELYMQAARGLKRASERLQVGGPAGCFGSWGVGKADCLQTFIDYCQNNASGLVPTNVKLNGTVPLDFVSTHVYSGGANNVNNADTITHHLATMKPIATDAGLYHILTEWVRVCWKVHLYTMLRHVDSKTGPNITLCSLNPMMQGGSYLNGAGTGSGVGHAVGGTANYNYHTPIGWRGEQQDTYETASFILQSIRKIHMANLTFLDREATSYWDISDVFEVRELFDYVSHKPPQLCARLEIRFVCPCRKVGSLLQTIASTATLVS